MRPSDNWKYDYFEAHLGKVNLRACVIIVSCVWHACNLVPKQFELKPKTHKHRRTFKEKIFVVVLQERRRLYGKIYYAIWATTREDNYWALQMHQTDPTEGLRRVPTYLCSCKTILSVPDLCVVAQLLTAFPRHINGNWRPGQICINTQNEKFSFKWARGARVFVGKWRLGKRKSNSFRALRSPLKNSPRVVDVNKAHIRVWRRRRRHSEDSIVFCALERRRSPPLQKV